MSSLSPHFVEKHIICTYLYLNQGHSFIESNNPEKMATGLTDMSDVINPEQESLAREAEAAISEWIRSQYK